MKHKEAIMLEKQGENFDWNRSWVRTNTLHGNSKVKNPGKNRGISILCNNSYPFFLFIFSSSTGFKHCFWFFAFRWWGVVCLVLCPVIYTMYFSWSSLGYSKLIGITTLCLIALVVHFFGNLGIPWITGFSSAFLFSLWFVRFLYGASAFFLREFISRNARAFEWLSSDLVIRHNEPNMS